jgi:hypothetical protein
MNSSDVTAGTNATASQYNNLRKDVVTGLRTYYSESDGATITFNLNNSCLQKVTLGGNRTLAVTNATAGQSFVFKLTQDATGNRTVTWFSTISWVGGVAPALTATANKSDVVGFICTGVGTYDGFVIGQYI